MPIDVGQGGALGLASRPWPRANDCSLDLGLATVPCHRADAPGRRDGRAPWSPAGNGAQPGQRRGGHRRAKARRIGIAEESDQAKERAEAAPRPAEGSARPLGKTIRLTHDEDGVVLADGGGKPAPAAPVRAYVAKAFGDHLAEARKALEDLAARYEPEELNRGHDTKVR